MKKYNYGVKVGFGVNSDSEEEPTKEEVIDRLREILNGWSNEYILGEFFFTETFDRVKNG